MAHGYSAYSNRSCRCSECRAGWAEYMRDWQRRHPEKMRAKAKRRYHSRRAKALEFLGGECVQCGSVEDLVFDHIDPATKSLEMRDAFTRNKWSTIEKELKKCQLLCQQHHGAKSGREGWLKRKETNVTVH